MAPTIREPGWAPGSAAGLGVNGAKTVSDSAERQGGRIFGQYYRHPILLGRSKVEYRNGLASCERSQLSPSVSRRSCYVIVFLQEKT